MTTATDAAKLRRARQTTRNLVLSLLACAGIVALMIIFVPRDESPQHRAVDVRAVASSAQDAAGWPLAAPQIPGGWSSNRADFTPASGDGVAVWYIGYITAAQRFVSVTQSGNANPTWVALELEQRKPTGQRTVDSITFDVYDYRDDPESSSINAYALLGEAAGTTLIFEGSATDDEMDTLVTATLASLPNR